MGSTPFKARMWHKQRYFGPRLGIIKVGPDLIFAVETMGSGLFSDIESMGSALFGGVKTMGSRLFGDIETMGSRLFFGVEKTYFPAPSSHKF